MSTKRWEELPVTRKQLNELVEATFTKVQNFYVHYSQEDIDALKERILKTIKGKKYVATDWWDVDHDCGCLVGGLYGPGVVKMIDAGEVTGLELRLACIFPGVVRDSLDPDVDDLEGFFPTLKVGR